MVSCARVLAAAILFMLALFPGAAYGAPQSYITEEVTGSYFYNGTLAGPITRTGQVQADVGNTQDVLQYIRIGLSSTSGTNLQSTTAYRNVAASPNSPQDRTAIFVNTTASTEDLYYQITNQSLIPLVSLRLDYGNNKGGREVLPEANTFSFNATVSSDRMLSGASVIIQARRNTFGFNDSFSFYNAYAATGTAQATDTDTDGFYDRVAWTGNLPSGDLVISFSGNITPGANFDGSLMNVDLDESMSSCVYTGYQTFTGMNFASRFSRGPVREGIEMIDLGSWVARGFIRNIASNLTYIIHGWDLYQVGNPSPVLSSTQPSYLMQGQSRQTDWHNSGVSGKPAYYSAAFDWEVVWGSSEYRGIVTSSMDMPVAYEMDSWADGTAGLQSNGMGGRVVMVNISARHLGHSEVQVNSFIFNSTLPRLASGGGGDSTWSASQIRVYYSDGIGTYDITSYATTGTAQSASGDGFVYASLQDIYSAIGNHMGQNDDIILSYVASSPRAGQNHNYTFMTNATLVTLSGTPVSKTAAPSLTIPGVFVPVEPGGGGGGGGGGAPPAYADIVKEDADAYFVAANMVKVIVSAGVIDSGGKGIKDVKILAYVPEGSELDASSATLRIYRNSTGRWENLANDRDFTVTDRGLTTIGSAAYREYLIKRATPPGALFESTIDMRNGDRIEVSYRTTVPFGTSYLLTRIFGYNYYEDKTIFEDAYIPVRREAGKLESLQIEESEWMQQEASVGKPVKWIKTFRIYNPNNVSVEEVVSTGVFQDSLTVEILEAGKTERTGLQLRGGNETLVNWYARMGGNRRKTYILEASTPPVLETKREIEVIESNRTAIRIIANITLENFARERYANVSFPFPVKRENILMISDPLVSIEDSAQGIRISIPAMSALETRGISIIYTETPPVMATTLDSLKYGCADSALLTVLVVPSESETNAYIETQIVGPEPYLITSHAELVDLSGAEPYEEVRIPLRISLESFPSGKYFVHTRLNKDFLTILSDTREFEIDCPGKDLMSLSWIFILVASILIVALLGIRVYRKRSYEKELSGLKKRMKEIK